MKIPTPQEYQELVKDWWNKPKTVLADKYAEFYIIWLTDEGWKNSDEWYFKNHTKLGRALNDI